MNNEQFKGKWNQAKGKIKEKWGKLTADDMTQINGKRDQLLGKLQSRYGWEKHHAEEELKRFEQSYDKGSENYNPEHFQEGQWKSGEESSSWKEETSRGGRVEREGFNEKSQWNTGDSSAWGQESHKGRDESERLKREKEHSQGRGSESTSGGQTGRGNRDESERLKREKEHGQGRSGEKSPWKKEEGQGSREEKDRLKREKEHRDGEDFPKRKAQ